MFENGPPDDRFRVSEGQARRLVSEFGTPLYVVGEEHFREKLRGFRLALTSSHPAVAVSFAAKANSTLAVLQIAHQEGYGIDVASEGELEAALRAGVPAADCHLHGNNKSRAELERAIHEGIGYIAVDNLEEIELLGLLDPTRKTKVLVRVAPGVRPETNAKISTGQDDTKFGFNISDGSARLATLRVLELGLSLQGFHCHVGSQLLNPQAQLSAGRIIAQFALSIFAENGYSARILNVGGGLGVRYTDEKPRDARSYCEMIAGEVSTVLAESQLSPVLAMEPGRSVVAESGVTLYQVGVVKTIKVEGQEKTFVSVDGGLADNPRPALYGAKYQVERVAKQGINWEYVTDGPGAALGVERLTRTVTVSGRHCETDKLFENVELPQDLGKGDILQVLTTGAYNSTMASNYNRYPRPATVMLRSDGEMFLAQERESFEMIFARERILKS